MRNRHVIAALAGALLLAGCGGPGRQLARRAHAERPGSTEPGLEQHPRRRAARGGAVHPPARHSLLRRPRADRQRACSATAGACRTRRRRCSAPRLAGPLAFAQLDLLAGDHFEHYRRPPGHSLMLFLVFLGRRKHRHQQAARFGFRSQGRELLGDHQMPFDLTELSLNLLDVHKRTRASSPELVARPPPRSGEFDQDFDLRLRLIHRFRDFSVSPTTPRTCFAGNGGGCCFSFGSSAGDRFAVNAARMMRIRDVFTINSPVNECPIVPFDFFTVRSDRFVLLVLASCVRRHPRREGEESRPA